MNKLLIPTFSTLPLVTPEERKTRDDLISQEYGTMRVLYSYALTHPTRYQDCGLWWFCMSFNLLRLQTLLGTVPRVFTYS
jgi:hypothetical protein